MAGHLKQTILDMYRKCEDPETVLRIPECIRGRGIDDRFGWAPYGWSHYASFFMLEDALRQTEGDILEIGIHEGEFTVVLCEFAKTAGKKVYAIDPWNGLQQGGNAEHQTFLQHCQEYIDDGRLIYRRTPSQSEEAREWIKSLDLCFAWVDGLHEFQMCSQDITTVKSGFNGPGIIGIDDIRGPFHFSPLLFKAACEGADPTWKHLQSPGTFVYTFLVREG